MQILSNKISYEAHCKYAHIFVSLRISLLQKSKYVMIERSRSSGFINGL